MKALIFTSVAALALTACASAPNSIEAQYVSSSQYEAMSCNQIRETALEVQGRMTVMERKIQKQYNSDNFAATIGVLLFWPALLFISGDGADDSNFANLKGQAEALAKVGQANYCEDIPLSPSQMIVARCEEAKSEFEHTNTNWKKYAQRRTELRKEIKKYCPSGTRV